MFNTKTAKSFEPLWIRAGVNSIIISKWELSEDARYVNMKAHKINATEENSTDFRMYITENALPYTLGKVKQIVHATAGPSVEIDAQTPQEFVSQLNNLTTEKPVFMLFTGEEYEAQDGTIKMRARMNALSNFVEKMTPDGNTNLVFDPNQHIKRLENTTEQPSADIADTGAPF